MLDIAMVTLGLPLTRKRPRPDHQGLVGGAVAASDRGFPAETASASALGQWLL
ncbi:MAG: hypothetical protein ACTIKH_13800 [Glutamicibacter ardleyensis]|uniref:hypothetical protein n=1 Tax=Glutamicibacter ardleyensis TaxID=225894 RepID=UPI003F95686F